MTREYNIRRIAGFRDSGGEFNPMQWLVDLTLTEGNSVHVITIGEHSTIACAKAHVDYHKARLMPREGGEYAPFDCTDERCLRAYSLAGPSITSIGKRLAMN